MPGKSNNGPKGLMMHVNTNVAALSANGSTMRVGQPQQPGMYDPPLASPTKKGWQASVATSAPPRPIRRTYRGDRSAASSTASLRNPGIYQASSRQQMSMNQLPQGGMHFDGRSTDSFNDRFKAIGRKMSFTKNQNDPSQIDLSLTSEENERNTGLGIHAVNSNSPSRRVSFSRSVMSNGSSAARTHLADNVGFSFKNTTNFVHPHRQTPRTFSTHSSRSRTQSYATGMYSDEADEDYAERMNSVAGSDGGWKSGWNMRETGSGSNSIASGGDMPQMDFPMPNALGNQRRSRASDMLDDAGVEDLAPVKEDISPSASPPRAVSTLISEEAELDPLSGPKSSGSDNNVSSSQNAPSMAMAMAVAIATQQRRPSSLLSQDSSADLSPGAGPQSSASTNHSNGSQKRSSGTSSPFEKAFGLLNKEKDSDPEDAASRAASIRAARAAFEEREAAKNRKIADRHAKRDAWLRRKSETVDWLARRRKPSIAVDSAIDDEQYTPASDASLDASDAEDSSPRHISGGHFVPVTESVVLEEAAESAPTAVPVDDPTKVTTTPRKSLVRASLPKLDVASIQEAAIGVMTMRHSRARSSLAKLAPIDPLVPEETQPLRNSLARQSSNQLFAIPTEPMVNEVNPTEDAKFEIPQIDHDTVKEDVSPMAEQAQGTSTNQPPIDFTPIPDGASPSTETNPYTPGGENALWPPISYDQFPLVETPNTATESMLWPPIDYNTLSATNSPRTGFANSPQVGYTSSPRVGFATGTDSDIESIRDGAKSERVPITPASAKGKGSNRFLSKLGFGSSKSRVLKV